MMTTTTDIPTRKVYGSDPYDYDLAEALLSHTEKKQTSGKSHPETCGPCEECASYLAERGFTLAQYVGTKPTKQKPVEGVCPNCGGLTSQNWHKHACGVRTEKALIPPTPRVAATRKAAA